MMRIQQHCKASKASMQPLQALANIEAIAHQADGESVTLADA